MQTIGFVNNNTKTKSNDTIVPTEFTHSCAIGQTGCGKTTSYIYPNLNERIKQNHGLIVFDYKGKEHNAVKYLAQNHNRLDDIVEIGKDWGESINIIKYMPNGELENFLKALFGLSDGENDYWGTSGANISIAILDIIGAIENIIIIAKDIGAEQDFEEVIKECRGFTYPTTKTLYSLSKATQSLKILGEFIKGLDRLSDDISDTFYKEIKDNQHIPKKKLLKKYKLLAYSIEILNKTIKKSKNKLEIFGDLKSFNNNSKTFQTILLSISTPLMNIANIKWLNDDKFDIVKSLDDKKIIVINTKTFSEFTLSAFTNSIFMELSKRTIYTNPNPISIFADEAQRIVSSSFDIPIDVLREAKVELFLAFQNSELMIEQLGENKYLSLLQNFKHRYIYKNLGMYNNYDLSCLDTFEYYIDDSDDTKLKVADAVFMTKDELFDVELTYQKQINLHERYSLENKDNNMILLYNEHALDDGILYLMNSKYQQSIRKYLIPEVSDVAKESILDILSDDGKDIDMDTDNILADFEAQLALMK